MPILWDAVVDVAGRSDWQSPLYAALAPLALLRPGSRRLALALWGFVAYLFLTWWLLTHRLDRFWLPLLPPLAILAGLGADWMRSRAWSILLGAILIIGLVTNFTYMSTALAGLNEWTGDLVFLRRDIPKRLNAPLAAIDKELPGLRASAPGRTGGGLPPQSRGRLQYRLQPGDDRNLGGRQDSRTIPPRAARNGS